MDKALQREQARLRKQRQRDKERAESVTSDSVTSQSVTEMFEGKPRYLVLSDGQVFDRTYQPKPNKHLSAMAACNRANETDLSMSKAERLGRLIIALDKDVTGIDGKENLLTMVRYGVSGIRLDEVLEEIR